MSLRPIPDQDSQQFWDACKAHRLVAQTCRRCERPQFPPGPRCRSCRADEFTWSRLPETATLYSWVVIHHAVIDEFRREAPYVAAMVDVVPGVRMPTKLVGCSDVDSLFAGMQLTVEFVDDPAGFTLHNYRPVAEERSLAG